MNSPNFEDCKFGHDAMITLMQSEGDSFICIELHDGSPIDYKALQALGDSQALEVANGGRVLIFKVNCFYDPLKVSRRVTEWLSSQGCKVSLRFD